MHTYAPSNRIKCVLIENTEDINLFDVFVLEHSDVDETEREVAIITCMFEPQNSIGDHCDGGSGITITVCCRWFNVR